jgi:hypothetical protein
MTSTQKLIMDKIKYYRDESARYLVKSEKTKADMAYGRADGLEEAYKIFISNEGN